MGYKQPTYQTLWGSKAGQPLPHKLGLLGENKISDWRGWAGGSRQRAGSLVVSRWESLLEEVGV